MVASLLKRPIWPCTMVLAIFCCADSFAQKASGEKVNKAKSKAPEIRAGRLAGSKRNPGSAISKIINAQRAEKKADPRTSASSPAEDEPLPGATAFNSCLGKYRRNRRYKVTLQPDAELKDLVGWISGWTCKKFIMASNLRSQKVTLISPEKVSRATAYRAFLSALEVMGLTVIPSGEYLKIVQSNWAIQSPIPLYTGRSGRSLPTDDRMVTQILRIKNVDANQLVAVMNKMKSRNGDVTAYLPANTLIVTDTAKNIRRMLRILGELDVPVTSDKIWVVRLRNGDAEEIQKILANVFASKGKKMLPKPVPKKANKGKPAPAQPQVDPSDAAGATADKIVVDPATNSLIIIASSSAFVKIAALIKKLDVPTEGVNQRIHVYYLENADAEEMATTLASLTGGAGARRANNRRNRRNTRSSPGAAAAASLFEGDVKVTADKATNALVIVASTKDFLAMRRVVRQLDIPRRQVFVEAAILEISMDKSNQLGFSYHGGQIVGEGNSQSILFGGLQHSELSSLLVNPAALMGLAAGARGSLIDNSGELLGLPTDIPAFGVMLQALQTNNNVNLLSAPHILTTDNEEAEITVGQNLPFQGSVLGGAFGAAAGQAGGAASLIPQISVQRQDVALTLKLTPHVNDSDMVRLEIEQEVSDVLSTNFNNLGPATSKRNAKTTVVVRDQQTVVIGGLMSDQIRNVVSKVPLLGDIPILGYLFKRTERVVQKTNLLIVLTPYVIRDQADLRRILQKKLRERREFIERYTNFEPREIAHEIDYRHKRGLLAEINRVGIQVEKEEHMLEQARRATDPQYDPVDMPQGVGAPDTSTAPEPPPAGAESGAKPKPDSDAGAKPSGARATPSSAERRAAE